MCRFQSTLPRRERPLASVVKIIVITVSIHAPTKGATAHSASIVFSFFCFNPRSHEGSDYLNCLCNYDNLVSIHAPTKGATDKERKQVLGYQVSIHAPTKGATIQAMTSYTNTMVSIHAPTKGATIYRQHQCRLSPGFNPRSHEGSDSSVGV